jgi:hypothetical protein
MAAVSLLGVVAGGCSNAPARSAKTLTQRAKKVNSRAAYFSHRRRGRARYRAQSREAFARVDVAARGAMAASGGRWQCHLPECEAVGVETDEREKAGELCWVYRD